MTTEPSGELDAYLDRVLIGGRRPVEVVLAEYDEAWPARFDAERKRLDTVLGATAVGIEHIGSTAVPGLAAKPIVDVLVTVDAVDPDDAFRPALETAGYVLRVREPGHRMFKSPEGDANVHIWTAGCEEARLYVVLRDRLRTSDEDRRLYERRKRELAGRVWDDVNHYADAKSDVIAAILARARG